MGSIPNGWNIMTLGDMCYKPQYGYTDSAREEPVGPKFLRIKDINKSPWIDWNSVPYCQCTERDAEKYRLSYGDILISRMADPGHAVMFEGDTMRYLHRT